MRAHDHGVRCSFWLGDVGHFALAAIALEFCDLCHGGVLGRFQSDLRRKALAPLTQQLVADLTLQTGRLVDELLGYVVNLQRQMRQLSRLNTLTLAEARPHPQAGKVVGDYLRHLFFQKMCRYQDADVGKN